MAAAIDSPLEETRTDSTPGVAAGVSREGGRANLLQGPGESPDRRGDGSGVTSPIADMIGLGYVELAAEAVPKPGPKLFLKLGVRAMGRRDEADVLWCRPNAGDLAGVMGERLLLLSLRCAGRPSGASWGLVVFELEARGLRWYREASSE